MRVFDSRRSVTIGALLLIITLVVTGAPSKEAPAVKAVKDLSFKNDGGSLEVKIATTEHAQYTYFELKDPHRLVVDFPGIHNAIGFKEKPIAVAGVERVRTSNFTDKAHTATRIVFDLSRNVSFKLSEDGEAGVRIVFDAEAKPAATTPAVPAAPEAKAAQPVRAPLSVTAGPPVIPAAQEPPKALPVTLRAPLTAMMTPLPPQATPPPAPPSAAPGGQTPPTQYAGELVSIEIKDLDVKDFFIFLSDFTGLNIVLDPSVTGSVTLSLKDVPWDQALDIVLKNLQLAAQLQGNVLRIAKVDTLQLEEKARTDLRLQQELSTEPIARTYILNYAKADQVSTLLSKVLSPRGQIMNDTRRNALIVTDIPNQFPKIDQTVHFLDAPAQQVLIEGRLLSANKSFSTELGTQLGFVIGNNSINAIAGAPAVGASPFRRNPPPNVTAGPGGSIPLNVNLPAAATSGISFLLGVGTDVLLDEIITAAEARGTAKLLSRPKVFTQNNQQATISQGTQIPVQTNQNNTISTQFLTFALSLKVTPQITDVGTILMNVQIENSTPDFARAVNGIPSVATQNVTTNILVGDGETAVLGGVLIDTDSYNLRQVPGLGSIPLVGHLFKNTQTIKSTAELLFFITPRIQTAGNLNPSGERPPGR